MSVFQTMRVNWWEASWYSVVQSSSMDCFMNPSAVRGS